MTQQQQDSIKYWIQQKQIEAKRAYAKGDDPLGKGAEYTAAAFQALLAAATKPTVVVGLTDEERHAIDEALSLVDPKAFDGLDENARSRWGVVWNRLVGVLHRDPGEYVAVRREDLNKAIMGLELLQAVREDLCGDTVSDLIDRLAPAIAKGGEPGGDA